MEEAMEPMSGTEERDEQERALTAQYMLTRIAAAFATSLADVISAECHLEDLQALPSAHRWVTFRLAIENAESAEAVAEKWESRIPGMSKELRVIAWRWRKVASAVKPAGKEEGPCQTILN